MIETFLRFLEQNMLRNPRNLVAFPASMAERMTALVEDVRVDRDEAIDGPVAL